MRQTYRGGIEEILAARRGALPSKAELQQRTSALIASHCPPPAPRTPADVLAEVSQLTAESGSSMTVEGLQRRCDEIMEEDFQPSQSDQACGSELLTTDDVYRGTLLDGEFDEVEGANSFQDAVSAFRGDQLAMEADQSE